MIFRKNEYPLRNIKRQLNKEAGQVSLTYGLFAILFLAIYLFAALKMEYFRTVSYYLEDALAASNLASAVVDIEEYGITNKIIIGDVHEAYQRYQNAVKGNLNLSDDWMPAAGSIISGKVRIVNYTVYNVDGETVKITQYDENGWVITEYQQLGETIAPNGMKVVSTSVYSEIAFEAEILPGRCAEAYKGSLADVVQCEKKNGM